MAFSYQPDTQREGIEEVNKTEKPVKGLVSNQQL